MRTFRLLGVIALVSLASGCMQTDAERALAGAAAGALIADATDENMLGGAAVGAAAGALCDDVRLCPPARSY